VVWWLHRCAGLTLLGTRTSNARMEKQLQEIAKKEGKVYIPPV
jgi:hypothetical protein